VNRSIAGLLVGVVGAVLCGGIAAADPLEDCMRVTRTGNGPAGVRCLEPLAQAGDPQAELRLGEQYGVVNESTYDPAKSAIWLRKAAEQGQIDAQVMLAYAYREGEGVPKDMVEAMRWYRTAADRGDQRAQSDMGLMYFKGWGTPRDVGQAISWWRKTADRGGPLASFAEGSIASIYLKGDGVPQDYAAAAHWFRKAAEHGDPSAYLSLAQIDEKGLAGPADPVEAYVGYSIALAWLHGSNGAGQVVDLIAKHRDDVAAKLTAEQIATANRLIRERRASIH